MIPESLAKAQIKRLSRLKYFPSAEDEAPLRADLVKTLREAENAETAIDIIDSWLRNSNESPTVADLYRITQARREIREDANPLEIKCEFCQDTGWEITAKGAIRCRHFRRSPLQAIA